MITIAILWICAQAPAGSAGASPVTTPVQSPAPKLDAFDALKQEYSAAEAQWTQAMRAAAADLQQRQALAQRHPAREFAARFQTMSDAGDGRALLWLATTIEYRTDQREEIQRFKRASFGKLVAQYADAPWCMDLIQQLALQRSWLETSEVLTLLESFAKQTKNKEAGAQALLKSYGILSGIGTSAEGVQRAGELRERIKQEYAETETGKRLAQDEFRAQHLMPGKPAPEFSAKDVEGVDFKLSDYRGKVVLLSFWGFWCTPCRELIPHERKLVERYKTAPFALVGVNSDSDKEVYKRMAQQEGVTWRSAWEGRRGGELSRLFQVKGYPTLYLIDHQGLVLKSWVGNPGEALLDREIERAVSAAQAAPKK